MTTEERRIELIRAALRQYPAAAASGFDATVGVDMLDDCAVVPLNDAVDLVIGSDFVRGEGFLLFQKGVLSRYDLGHYIVGANASDLAAMGAAPLGLTLVYRYADDTTDAEFQQVLEGVSQACKAFSIPLLGGDTGSYDVSVLAGTAIGICPHDRALLRSRGKPGDALYLTGITGLAAAAIAYYCRCRPDTLPPGAEDVLADSWRRVSPALLQARHIVDARLSCCGIDTSDGLRRACELLARASGVDAVLTEDAIPIHPLVESVARFIDVDPLDLTLAESVDFRLLFSVPPEHRDELLRQFDRQGWTLYEIGYLTKSHGAPAVYLQSNGRLRTPIALEWSQLAGQ